MENSFLLQRGWKSCSEWCLRFERERVCDLFLDFLVFGPSVLDGARSKVDLRSDTRGHRFGGVPTTPRGRDLFLLGLFFF